MKKKLITTFLTSVTLVSVLASPVFAHDNSISKNDTMYSSQMGISRYRECGCGGRLITRTTHIGDWHYSDREKSCSHKAHGHDVELIRTYTNVTKCTSCSYYYEGSSTESKWECRGY